MQPGGGPVDERSPRGDYQLSTSSGREEARIKHGGPSGDSPVKLPGVLGALDQIEPGDRERTGSDTVELSGGGLQAGSAGGGPKWVKVLDQTRCIGCHACTTACKSENEVPLGVTRTYVKSVDIGYFPQARRAFQVTRCNMCEDAPCVNACPTSAMYQRDDGLVDFDKSICIGCKACIAACPYDAIFINPDDHSAEKCNFCTHRLDMGLEPACVVVCPVEAILVGDVNDRTSQVSKIVNRDPVTVRRPEKETRPKVFYKGAHHATLDPIAARRPEGDGFMWSQQRRGGQHVVSGHPMGWNNSSAAALLSYDVPHEAPWDWRVSLYTWTKGIAAGSYLVPLLLILVGALPWSSALFEWATPIMGGLFLALTGGLLIWDLTHPRRFYVLFTRPQWKSWLVKGGAVIAAYGVVLLTHFASGVLQSLVAIPVDSLLGSAVFHKVLALIGAPLSIMTAIYTAYLFAQSKGRDLWQSSLLPPHMFVQMLLGGSAAFILLAVWLEPTAVVSLGRLLGASALTHLLLVWGEATFSHPTAHAHLALWEMTRGRFARYFWCGVVLCAVALLAPLAGPWVAPFALVGLLAHEHAYVQAAQAVPLA
jgi:Fe-S-cluster-containing dehydrogenase component/formate-dependent nitrite reductase membrane component NrfD